MGRFLNADAFASTGQGLLGNNMFAYCGNNPVNCSDPSGYYIRAGFSTNAMIEGYATPTHPSADAKCSPTVVLLKKTINVIVTTINVLFNDDEQAVIDASSFAFYKGVPIVKIKALDNCAFSFGMIFMCDEKTSVTHIRHEYGHVLQLLDLGLEGYVSLVAIPSIIGFAADELGVLPEGMYYNLPWEYVADMYGQAGRGHSPAAAPIAEAYWNFAKIVSRIMQVVL